MSKKLFVIGAYGCGNRGDDALLQSIAENFSEYDICATCGNFENIEQWLPVKQVRCRLNEGISLAIFFSMIKSCWHMAGTLLRSKALIYGGGSLIHDLTPYNLPFLYLWHAIAKLFRKKVFYFCVGVGPLNTRLGKRMSSFFLSRANGVFVRDQRGLNYCKEIGAANARLVKDAAFLVTAKNQCGGEALAALGLKENEYVCVTASQWFASSNFWEKDSMDFSQECQNFMACVDAFRTETKKKLVFVPTVFHDKKIGEALKAHCDPGDFILVPENYNSRQMAEIIENSWMLLGVRMHSMIFAARQGVPFLPLVYDEKVNQLLLFLDMQQYAIDLSEITPAKVQEGTKEILSEYSLIQEKLKKKAAQFCSENSRAVQEVKSILNGKG